MLVAYPLQTGFLFELENSVKSCLRSHYFVQIVGRSRLLFRGKLRVKPKSYADVRVTESHLNDFRVIPGAYQNRSASVVKKLNWTAKELAEF